MKNDEIVSGGYYEPSYVISSGSLLLDRELTATGGIPSGGLVHYMSKNEGSFKTSFSLQGLIEVQKLGHPVGFVDCEHALDIEWAKAIGIDTSPEMWFYSRPSCGEIALQHVEDMIIKHGCKGVVFDSVDAAQPSKIMKESEYGDSSIGQHAKLITQGARRISNVASEHDAIVWFINQMKVNLTRQGAMGHQQTGGKGLPFYAKLNLELDREKSNSQLDGAEIIPLKMTVRRSKLGASFRTVHTFAIQGKGVDRGGELFVLAREAGLLKQAGSWWKLTTGDSIGQGEQSAVQWCKDNEQQIKEFLNDGDLTRFTV